MLTMATGADLRRTRLAIAAAFLTQGLVFISLTTRLPRIQDRWDLGELALSGLLLMMVLLAGVGSLVAERLAAGMILRADVSRRSGLASPRPGDGVLASWHPTAARSFADVAP